MRKSLLSGHRHVFLLLLFAVLAVVSPQRVSAQAGRLTFSMQNATLKEIINEVQRISDYDFVYSDTDVTGVPRRNANFNNSTINQVLTQVLANTGLEGQINGNTIVIRKVSGQSAAKTVTGQVTDQSGRPLVGVTVVVKGSSIGVTTDGSGRYSINIPAGSQPVLAFSYIGMNPQELAVGAQATTLNVTMTESSTTIADVVVTGMFERARESYTGSISEITRQELELFRGQNLVRTIANIDPALNIAIDNIYGSDPNRLMEINVRGNSSLPSSLQELNEGAAGQLNTPLIIMDGFPISLTKLMDFNDENVESISILKDASATSIYGSRGANGVIVITTKRPAEGAIRVNFNVGLNIEVPDLSSYDLMNAREKLQLEAAAGLYSSDLGPAQENALKEKYYEKLAEIERGADTYWLSKPLRTSVGQRYTLGIEYGSDRFQVGAELMYNNIAGVMKESYRNTFSGSIMLQYEYKNLRFKNQTMIDLNNANNSPYGTFSDYAAMNPYWRTHDKDGVLIESYTPINSSTPIGNPLYNASLNIVDKSKYTTITNNFEVQWEIIENLRFTANLGLSKHTNTSDYFLPPSHTSFSTSAYSGENVFKRGSYTYGTGESTSLDANVRLDYTKNWNDRHMLVAGINYSINQTNSFDYTFDVQGFTNDHIDFLPNAMQYMEGVKPIGNENETRAMGFTGNVNYTYDNRYYVDLSYRVDGSSIFGEDNRFAPFWSAGAGWNIHNEEFLKSSNAIDRFRLRFSIGETGSQNFQPHQALSTFKYQSDKRYMIWSGADLMGLGNSELKWQTTLQTNVGIEMAFFKNLFSFELDLYHKKTRDLLSAMDIPLAHGFATYMANVGKVENKGFEASVGAYLIRNTELGLMWRLNGKIAYNKNEILELSQAIKDQTEYYMTENVNNKLLFEGHSVNSIYVVPSLGIDPSTGREVLLDKDGNISGWNSNTSGYNANARKWFGISEPKYRGNISSMLQYKNFIVNLSFAYHWGGQQYNSTLQNKVEVTRSQMEKNVDKRVYDDRWKNPGDKTFFKAFSDGVNYQTSRFVMDDNVFQLQNVSVTYRWHNKYLKDKVGVDLINFTGNMSDVFYLSSIKRERGTSYPFSRKIALTISLQF